LSKLIEGALYFRAKEVLEQSTYVEKERWGGGDNATVRFPQKHHLKEPFICFFAIIGWDFLGLRVTGYAF
jgi:hypothetical protein